MSERTQKLVALRSRTDYDLLVLVNRELDHGFALVNVVTTRNSTLFAQAHRAYQTVTALLPRISCVSQDDRLRIEARSRELRSRLDQVPVYANAAPFPASFAS